MHEFRGDDASGTGCTAPNEGAARDRSHVRRVSRLTRAVAVALFLSAVVSAAPQGTPPPPCIEVRSEARYRAVGYDHIVHIDNHCDASAVCDVWTNVNPEPARASIPPKESVELLTFRGSPAREFTAYTQCRLVL